MRKFTWFNAVSLTFGFAFLYIPMIILIVYSFNESKLVTVWAGSPPNGTESCCKTRPFLMRLG